MTNPLSEQVARISDKVAALARDRVTERLATVTAIDPVTSTFTVTVPGTDDPIAGIAAPPQFLPAVFDIVRLTLVGSTPSYQPDRLNSASQTITLAGLEVLSSDPVFGGVPLSTTLGDYSENVPWWGSSETDGPTVTSTETGYKEIIATLKKGRRYSIHTSGFRVDASAASQQFWVSIRYTTADGATVPSTPTVSDQIVTRQPVDIVSGNAVGYCSPLQGVFLTPAGDGDVTYRFLITLSRVIGSGSAYIRANNLGDANSIWFNDHGPITDPTLVVNAGSGGVVTSAPKTYTWEQSGVWGASWRADGFKYPEDGNRYQGQFSTGGNRYSAVGFADVTGVLAGATVTRVQVLATALFWTPDDGGTAVLGIHGHTTEPADVSAFSLFDIKRQAWTTKSGAKWIDLPSTYFAGWVSGSYRGIVYGPAPSTSSEYAGYFQEGGTRLKITYTR